MPVVLGICAAAKIPASRQLMPFGLRRSVGGIITLVGTPPNIIVSGAFEILLAMSRSPFFEFAWIGIPFDLLWLSLT